MLAHAATRISAGVIFLATLHAEASAHALGQRYDLPLPLQFYLLAAGAAVALSFAILALFVRKPTAGVRSPEYPLVQGTIPAPVVIIVQVLSVGTLVLIVVAGLFGHQNPFKNIAPVTVWVIYWVGLTLLSAFVGNIWPLLSPWAAAFDLAEGLMRRWTAKGLTLERRYPAWLGAWPACLLFLIFVWFELVANSRDVPRNIAIALVIYSALTWAGFAVFGRDAWSRNGEAFSVAFDLFGRFAPLRVRRNSRWRWSLHAYGSGLLADEPLNASLTAFTLLMLGTVTVDGLMETPLWASTVELLLTSSDAGAASLRTYSLLATALLVVGPLLLAGLYLCVIALMARIAGGAFAALAGLFVLTLVPIAIAYHLAHYFSLLMLAGQFIIPLISDPLGYGWDLFGTTLYRIDIGIVDARFIWYLAVAAIVSGHIIAVWLAHITAFRIYNDPAGARRSQYPMLVLMISYTMLSLWILAQPIVEPGSASVR